VKKKFLALPWQLDFLAYEPTDGVSPVIGGVRSGKSWIAGAKFVKRIQKYPRSTGNYIIVPTLKQARDGTLKTFKATLRDLGVEYKQSGTDLSISIKLGPKLWSRIIIWPESEFERLKGQEIDTTWCDEAQVWQAGSAAYDFIQTRLSPSPEAVEFHPDLVPEIILTANPPHSTSHWLYQYFVKRRVANKVWRVGSHVNYLLPNREQYLKRLKDNLSPEVYAIEVLGEWGDIGVGRTYTQFSDVAHVSEYVGKTKIAYDPKRPLILTNDFGVDPRVAIVIQVHDVHQPGWQKKVPVVLDEFRIRNGSTMSLIEEFTRVYPPEIVSELVLYGDPAGNTRNSTTGVSDWAMMVNDPRMKNYLTGRTNVASGPPLVVDRINAVNAKLRNASGDIGLVFHPKCVHTIEDMQQTRWKEGTRQLDKGTPAKGILRTHLSDALGYFIHKEWPLGTSSTRVTGNGWMAR